MELNRSKTEGLRKLAHKNIRRILKILGVTGSDLGARITGACPIRHIDSITPNDNRSAFSWDMNRHIWACFSNHCHTRCGNDIFGLIRSVKDFTFKETIEWLVKFLDINEDSIPIVSEKEILEEFDKFKKVELFRHIPLDIKTFDKLSSCKYFISRGISQLTLDELKCGYMYSIPDTFGYNRALIPIFDPIDGYLVGFTGRDISEKSSKKWMHFRNFDASFNNVYESLKVSHLIYNLYFIKNAGIKDIIIMEGALDVVKLWDLGIKNGVAIFGTNLSSFQLDLLLKAGIQSIAIMMDGDPPGYKAAKTIQNKLSNYFNVKNIVLDNGKDPKDLKLEEIHNLLK